ncbi:hypothetical protein VYU27_009959, partial [Nannochloropsis oceanica]
MKKSSSSNSSKGGKGRGGASDSSSPSTAPASSSFSSQRLTQLFDSFLSDDPEEDRQDVRVLVLMWKLGARRRPGQISREEFEGALKQLELDTLDKLRDRLLPSLDVDFLQGDDFKSFYRFAFLFSLEGTRRNI